jgi:archaellum component FlaF (FlaF/FlaG flagellin family)
MKKALLFAMLLAVLALGTLSAQIREIYSQPYPADADGMPAVRQAYTSILATAQNFDFRFADNFNGLTDPINQITFYGVSTFWNGYWVATEPAATEPFHVRFYNYTGSWTQSPQSLIAEETGTYTVNLYDSYDDGWGRSKLDVLVNGVVVLQSITLASGAGPEAYTFFANAGDVISTIFTAGSYAYENWYEILDPNNFVIATDGEGDSVPTGLNIPQPLIAPETGTYTVNLYDNYGDGWDGSRLNVYVNGIVVLEGITLAAGYGPEAYTFTANTGDEICAVFRAGDYPDENWYEILDPNGVIIATDGPDPQGIGFVSTYEVDEPDWNNPAYEYLALDVSTTYIGPTNLAGNSGFYQYDIILPEAVNMAEGWVSVQASIDDGATTWFMWSVCDVAYGDGSSWQYVAAKSRNRVNNAYVTDGNVRGHIPRDVAFTLYTDDDITVPGPESTLGGTLPDELQGTDAIIYTVESTGIRNVTVLKPAEFTGEWYCWLQDIVGLRAAANPIPADTESWTFYEVLFEAKAPVTVVIDERDLNTVPVELSSFTATITAQNYVKLAWTSQSESNIMGYNLYRNESLDLSAAIKITDLIAGTNTSEAHTYTYLDQELEQTGTYYYWLQVSDLDGSSIYHGPINVVFSQGEEGGTPDIPFVTRLENAYPNPFNPNTNIRYQLEKPGDVKIDIYNARGQLVRSFSSYHAAAGYYQINWDGRDSSGKAVSSGVYQYKMTSGKYHSTKKMVLKK